MEWALVIKSSVVLGGLIIVGGLSEVEAVRLRYLYIEAGTPADIVSCHIVHQVSEVLPSSVPR